MLSKLMVIGSLSFELAEVQLMDILERHLMAVPSKHNQIVLPNASTGPVPGAWPFPLDLGVHSVKGHEKFGLGCLCQLGPLYWAF
jgi:hypothetical protein